MRCSNMFTGEIDARFYGGLSKDECIAKARQAGCTARLCDGENCEVVY